MAFTHSQAARQYGDIGSVPETSFYTEWRFSRSLFPRMCLHKEWDTREWYPKDVVVPTEASSLGDTNDSGFISDLDFSPSGRLLVASSSSNTLFVLDPNLSSPSLVQVWDKPHRSAISKVCWVSDYQFVSGSADSTIGYWDIRNPSEALNFLHFHHQPIRSLNYFPDREYLISSCQEGGIHFWHLPSFAVRREDQENNPSVQSVLLKCPNLKHCCFSESQKLATFSNNTNTLFTVQNLSIDHLTEDIGSIIFDDSTSMQLCWIKPNAMPGRRNRVKIADCTEYSPVPSANVSNVSHLSMGRSPLTLIRLTTTRALHCGSEVKEWTCVCSLKEETPTDKDPLHQYMNSFGSNVLYGTVRYTKEEMRYSSFREKQASLSRCGRVIASPDIHGIRLLKFSPDMDTGTGPSLDKPQNPLDFLYDLDDIGATPSSLEVITCLPSPEKSVLCCKFSPSDTTLLAAGDNKAKIKFYKPKL